MHIITSCLSRYIPRVEVVQIPSAASVDSLVATIDRTITGLQRAALDHSAAAAKHREQARAAEQAAAQSHAEAFRATRVADKLIDILS